MDIVKLYIGTSAALIIIDSVWLLKVTPLLYRKHLGHILAANPNLAAAALFYAIYVAALIALVIIPAAQANSLARALWSGALFGLVCYATYDLTSQAVIKKWPVIITVIDMAWGVVLTLLVSIVGFYIARWIGFGA